MYEFAQQSTYLVSATAREADSLPYSGWAILMDNKNRLRSFTKQPADICRISGDSLREHCIMGQKICRSPQLPLCYVRRSKRSLHLGQVMAILPLCRGTRTVWRQRGQMK